MLDITLLGTGGTMPMKNRFLTSCFIRTDGRAVLIDCGEGTQVAVRWAERSLQRLELLLITHFHADHISGLPGLLLSMGVDGRTEPLRIAGPQGLRRIVEGLRVIAPELPFPIEFTELTEPEQTLSAAGLQITAFSVLHTMPCYGFKVTLPRAGRFDPERARAAGVPLAVWGKLQKQETAEYNGTVYRQEQVLGPPRRGLTAVYCTDTRPVPAIAEQARDADLLMLEGMYGDPEKFPRAAETRHMMISEAAKIAKEANAKRLWLTHYSPAMPDPAQYLPLAQEIFPATVCAKDGMQIDLPFTD